MKLYLLHHVYETEEGCEEVKLIGIYSSYAKAEQALARAKEKPGFAERPNGFEIGEEQLDRDGWVEGFIRIRRDGNHI